MQLKIALMIAAFAAAHSAGHAAEKEKDSLIRIYRPSQKLVDDCLAVIQLNGSGQTAVTAEVARKSDRCTSYIAATLDSRTLFDGWEKQKPIICIPEERANLYDIAKTVVRKYSEREHGKLMASAMILTVLFEEYPCMHK